MPVFRVHLAPPLAPGDGATAVTITVKENGKMLETQSFEAVYQQHHGEDGCATSPTAEGTMNLPSAP